MEVRTNSFPILEVASTSAVALASSFDAFIHTFPQHRFMLGETLGNHTGNTLLSAGPVIGATLLGGVIAEEGARLHCRALEIIGEALPVIAVATMAVANLAVECFPGNYQFVGDMTNALLTIPVAYVAAQSVIDRCRNNQIESDLV